MRILITSWPGSWQGKNPFSRSDEENIGGAEIQAKLLAMALSEDNDVAYVGLGRTPEDVGGVRLYSRQRPSEPRRICEAYADAVLSAFDEFTPDVVLSYLMYPAGDVVAAALQETLGRARILLGTVEGSWEWRHKNTSNYIKSPVPRNVEGSALKHNDFFFARSIALGDEIARLSRGLVRLLRPIVHVPSLPFKKAGSSMVLCFGRLAKPKRFDLIIRAFYFCLREGLIAQNALLMVVGDGPDRGTLEGLARSGCRGPYAKVKFAGTSKHEDIFHHLSHSRIAIHASESEGYGTAPIESYLCEVPTVVAGFPQVTLDLTDFPGLYKCDLSVIDLARAMEQAWHNKGGAPVDVAEMYSPTRISQEVSEFIIGIGAH